MNLRFLQHIVITLVWLAFTFTTFAVETNSIQKKILFLGDSITAYDSGYVHIIDSALKKQNPENFPHIINGGKCSETVSGLSEIYHPGVRPCLFARLDNELERQKPDWVVACYGMNCGIYHPFDKSRFEAYKNGINELVKRVRTYGSHLILLTSPPYAKKEMKFPKDIDATTQNKLISQANEKSRIEAIKNPNKYGFQTPYIHYDYVMETYATWLLTLNDQEDVWVIDLRKALLPRLKETHRRDSIHPNKIGHDIMANSFLEQWSRIKKEAKLNR